MRRYNPGAAAPYCFVTKCFLCVQQGIRDAKSVKAEQGVLETKPVKVERGHPGNGAGDGADCAVFRHSRGFAQAPRQGSLRSLTAFFLIASR